MNFRNDLNEDRSDSPCETSKLVSKPPWDHMTPSKNINSPVDKKLNTKDNLDNRLKI